MWASEKHRPSVLKERGLLGWSRCRLSKGRRRESEGSHGREAKEEKRKRGKTRGKKNDCHEEEGTGGEKTKKEERKRRLLGRSPRGQKAAGVPAVP